LNHQVIDQNNEIIYINIIHKVEEITIDLNFSVTFIILYLKSQSIIKKIQKVQVIACKIIQLYKVSNFIEITQSNNQKITVYIGAKYLVRFSLKDIIIEIINHDINNGINNGIKYNWYFAHIIELNNVIESNKYVFAIVQFKVIEFFLSSGIIFFSK